MFLARSASSCQHDGSTPMCGGCCILDAALHGLSLELRTELPVSLWHKQILSVESPCPRSLVHPNPRDRAELAQFLGAELRVLRSSPGQYVDVTRRVRPEAGEHGCRDVGLGEVGVGPGEDAADVECDVSHADDHDTLGFEGAVRAASG